MLQSSTAGRRKTRFDTLAVHGRYGHREAAENRGSICEPVYLSPAQHFAGAEEMRAALMGEVDGWIYTRLGNPTVKYLEDVIALLEGYGLEESVSSCVAPSGMAAIFMAATALVGKWSARSGRPNIVIPASSYGGTYMLFMDQFGRDRGIEIRLVVETLEPRNWEALIDADTRFVFCEVPSNPLLRITDIRALSAITAAARVPLMVDATIPTPALLRPLCLGADIVVHSASKTMSASGLGLAGVVSARKNIAVRLDDEAAGRDFATHLKKGLQRSSGIVLSPSNAIQTIADIRSLRQRVEQMSNSALEVARRLDAMPGIARVHYPGLPDHHGHDVARRDMQVVDSELEIGGPRSAFGYLLSVEFDGGLPAATTFFDNLKMIWRANDLGRVKSCATMPTISTHSQLSKAERAKGELPADLIRLSLGIEHVEDIFADIEQALSEARVLA